MLGLVAATAAAALAVTALQGASEGAPEQTATPAPAPAAPPRSIPTPRGILGGLTVPTLPAAGPVDGWVIDGAGQPVEGVAISAPDGDGPLALTDADGAFRLAALAEGEHTLVLDGPHIFTAQVRWTGGEAPPRVMVTRRMSVVARVTGRDGPVAGAEVTLADGSGPALHAATTGDDGLIAFTDLPPGVYELWARRGDRVSPLARAVRFGADSQEAIELRLGQAATVRGRVRSQSGAGVAASVMLVPEDVDHVVRQVVAKDSGHFAIEGVPRGRWHLEASAPGYLVSIPYVVDTARPRPELSVELRRGGVLTGRVVDAVGEPVADATVVLRGHGARRRMTDGALRRTGGPRAESGARGRWVHPLAGTRQMPIRDARRFGAQREGVRPAECGRGHCGVDLGTRRGSVVHAAAGGVVAAVVTEDRGRAGRFVTLTHDAGIRTSYLHLDVVRADLAPGQRVRAGEPLGTLGRSGIVHSDPHLHFAMSQDHRGRTWFIDPEPMLLHAVVLPEDGSLEAHSGADDAPGPTLVATVLDADDAGAPPAAADLAAGAGRFTTDAAGRFRIEGVVPGSYVASAFHPELARGASRPLVIRPDRAGTDVTIELSAGVIVSGLVRDRDGPVSGARIEAREGQGASAIAVGSTVTDASGRFELRPLAGELSLTVTAPGRGAVERDVVLANRAPTPQRRDENFELRRKDAELRGLVRDPGGFPARGVLVRIAEGPGDRGRRTVTDEHGAFSFADLAAGSYRLDLTSRGYPDTRRTAHTDRPVALALAPGGGVRLDVRDAHTRAGLAGARVEAGGPEGARLSALTDARGTAELTPLAPGRWTVRVRRPGHVGAVRILEVRPGRTPRAITHEEIVELSQGATLAGVVRDETGARLAGARVRLGAASTTTDQDGRFRLTDVATGPVELVAERGGRLGRLNLELSPGDELVTLQLDVGAAR